eukprot:gnl/TRDRNA2_/TRDRNA2_176956_c0_seq2.p1 gnl/TRDRNA2_/TRDRNA2_176956_c0~~gnl/TRDRNA2_/TRDRNA2_176956_c0_seq2.p1  ORF type:complete len:312 (+),score=34.36 gnl/TRDRNA2_/TRDRNA2_176956_c0_seq2:95-937(+)
MIAASLGARHVIAIEANEHVAALAHEIVERNGYKDRIHVINKMSVDVTPEDLSRWGRPDVLLSELFGTWLLGESALHYVMDARERLVSPNSSVVPLRGRQLATLVESPDLASVTSVKSWEGVDLGRFNQLQDTASLMTTKDYGFRFSSSAYRELSPHISVLEVDFSKDRMGIWEPEMRVTLRAIAAGTVHAVLTSWEVYADDTDDLVMSTHPDASGNNFARDMQWGQGLQLIEDTASAGVGPAPFVVAEGELLELTTRFSANGNNAQFKLERVVAGTRGR